jgi:hypothetical protein
MAKTRDTLELIQEARARLSTLEQETPRIIRSEPGGYDAPEPRVKERKK